jgi:hypothetical protein
VARSQALLEQQGDRPLATDAAARAALRDRGYKVELAGAETPYIRVLEAELRSLEQLHFSPQLFMVSSKGDPRAKGALGVYNGHVMLGDRAGGAMNLSAKAIDSGSGRVMVERGREKLAAGRLPFSAMSHLQPTNVRIKNYIEMGMAADDAIALTHVIRHEYAHGIESTLLGYVAGKDPSAMRLYGAWQAARDAAMASNSAVSKYAMTNTEEYFAETVGLALSGEWAKIPPQLRGPVRAILEYRG